MAGLVKACQFTYGHQLATHNRNIVRSLCVHDRGIQTHEAHTVRNAAFIIVELDDHIIRIRRTVYTAAGAGLHKVDQGFAGDKLAGFQRQVIEFHIGMTRFIAAENTPVVDLVAGNGFFTINGIDLELIVRQEGEVIIHQPLHKCGCFRMLGTVFTHRLLLQNIGDFLRLVDHVRIILNTDIHIFQYVFKFVRQLIQHLFIRMVIHFDIDNGFWRFTTARFGPLRIGFQLAFGIAVGVQHTVMNRVQGNVAGIQLNTDGIDQERHIVVDDFNHRM